MKRSNPFHFKQFSILQEHSAMKVTTDACLFGAWVARQLQSLKNPAHLLDIGTGTGLLSLMIAQKNDVDIDAVEMDPVAAKEAAGNVSASPWADHIHVFPTRIQDFHPAKPYDVIISNPPFFENDLPSGNAKKDAAKHHHTLSFEVLVGLCKALTSPNGRAYLLVPFHRLDYLEKQAKQHGLFTREQLLVRQTPAHDHFRALLGLSKIDGKKDTAELSIHDAERKYTAGFVELLSDYYLNL